MQRNVGLHLPGQPKNIPPVQVNPDDLENYTCKNCEGEVFEQRTILKRLSALQSGNTHDTIVPIPIFVCSHCSQQLHIATD